MRNKQLPRIEIVPVLNKSIQSELAMSTHLQDLLSKETIRVISEINNKKLEIINESLKTKGIKIDWSLVTSETRFKPLLYVDNICDKSTDVYYNDGSLDGIKLVSFIPCHEHEDLKFNRCGDVQQKISLKYRIHD